MEDTLAKLNNYKGQISNKVATITKEHKFFTDNVTCPTCNQTIEESFRLNKIKDVQLKAKELQSGYQELEQTIKKEQEGNVNSPHYQRRLLNLRMAFLKTILSSLTVNDSNEIWKVKFKHLPTT